MGRWAAPPGRFDPHLGGGRPGIAGGLHVRYVLALLERVEVAGQHAVTVEIEQAALRGQDKAKILVRRELGDLPEMLVLGVVAEILGAALALVLELQKLLLG